MAVVTVRKSIGEGGIGTDRFTDSNVKDVLFAIVQELKDLRTKYNAHTHECPGSSYAASRCSLPDTGAPENSLTPSAASAGTQYVDYET